MPPEFDFMKDFPRRPKRPERLFFSLFPEAETSNAVVRLRQRFLSEHHIEARDLEAERLHVSLHHIGDYKSLRTKFVYAARQAGKAVSMPPFVATFRYIKSFEGAPQRGGKPPKRPLVLLGEGAPLFELHRSLGAAMRANGFRAGEHFTPHMTLSYGPQWIPLQEIEPIRFVVNKIVLIHSRLWLTQYEVLGSWSLSN